MALVQKLFKGFEADLIRDGCADIGRLGMAQHSGKNGSMVSSLTIERLQLSFELGNECRCRQ